MNDTERHIERLEEHIRTLGRVITILSKGHEIPFTLNSHYIPNGHTEILGDIMTIEEFEAQVKSGGFIDYDGHGYFCTPEMESDIKVTPSSFPFLKPCVSKELTHVIWFNR